METAQELNEAFPIGRDYWLAHCEGYQVQSEEGRIGLVEDVRHAPDGRADTLAVRAGMLGRRRLLVPAEEVALIVPRAERVVLRAPARITGSELREG